MHLFCILLICQAHPTALCAANVNAFDVRIELGHGLETMKSMSRNSLMSAKARKCLLKFLQVYDELVSPTSQQIDDTAVVDASNSTFFALTTDVSPTLAVDQSGNFSQYITQAADDFLWEFSQADFMDADFDWQRSSNMDDVWNM